MPGMIHLDVDLARKANVDLIELKLDGTRMTYNNGTFVSDRNCERSSRYPHIYKIVSDVPWKVRGEVALPGGNILQLNRKENWKHAHFYAFDLYEYEGQSTTGLSIIKKRALLDRIVGSLNSDIIHTPEQFASFDDGWKHVVKTSSEGLVLKSEHETWKCKHLIEEKLRIIEHVAGRSKGSFIVERNGIRGKVSGTSMQFVNAFKELKRRSLSAYAEIEYAFLTDDGVPYQPRLRRLGTLDMLATT